MKYMEKRLIARYAEEIYDYFGTADPFIIAERLGIEIEYRRYGSSVKGYYRKIFNKLYIVINSNYSPRSQRIICAHELGHALLHTEYSESIKAMSFKDYDTDGLEYEANLFAVALLIDPLELSVEITEMDNYLIKEIFKDNMSFCDNKNISK